jgi:hypothetical protein
VTDIAIPAAGAAQVRVLPEAYVLSHPHPHPDLAVHA